jgi:hypothetical protein
MSSFSFFQEKTRGTDEFVFLIEKKKKKKKICINYQYSSADYGSLQGFDHPMEDYLNIF